jgi:cyclic lactone autoinducer peptide
MKKVYEAIAAVAVKTAKAAGNSASFFGVYQPVEPQSLKKTSKKDK